MNQCAMVLPEMTSLFTLGPFIVNEVKSHHVVPTLQLGIFPHRAMQCTPMQAGKYNNVRTIFSKEEKKQFQSNNLSSLKSRKSEDKSAKQ